MGEWSPSHLIVAAIAVATIIGQLIIVLTRLKTVTERLEKRLDRQDEAIRQQGLSFVHALERLEERMDKRIENQGEMFYTALERLEERMDKRFVEVNQRIDGLRSEMNQRFSDMNGEIADVRTEMRQLNQNHIEHLNRHHSQ